MPAKKSDNGRKWWFIGPLITVIVIGAGIVGSWYTGQEAVANTKVQVEQNETQIDENRKQITELRVRDAKQEQGIEFLSIMNAIEAWQVFHQYLVDNIASDVAPRIGANDLGEDCLRISTSVQVVEEVRVDSVNVFPSEPDRAPIPLCCDEVVAFQ